MSSRLEAAIRQLTEEQVEALTREAEEQAAKNTAKSTASNRQDRYLKLDWVGGLSGEPEQSGLEAQQTAKRLRIEAIERNLGA